MKLQPVEVNVGNSRFMIGNLSVFDSLTVTRLIAPVVPAILASGMIERAFDVVSKSAPAEGATLTDKLNELSALIIACDPVLQRIAQMPEDEFRRVVEICLSCVERWNEAGKSWGRVMSGSNLMFDDMDQAQIMVLVFRVVVKHLAPFGNALGGSS